MLGGLYDDLGEHYDHGWVGTLLMDGSAVSITIESSLFVVCMTDRGGAIYMAGGVTASITLCCLRSRGFYAVLSEPNTPMLSHHAKCKCVWVD